MSSRFDRAYRVDGTTKFDAAFWNRVLRDIDTRVVSVEEKKVAFEEAERTLLDLGLRRINETLLPLAEHIMRIGELGFLAASSQTPAKMTEGDVVTIIVEGDEQRDLFRPSPFIGLTRRSTLDDYAIARTISYDNGTGKLIFQVEVVVGNGGPHNDWDVSALAASVAAMVSALDETRSLHGNVADGLMALAQTELNIAEDRALAASARDAALLARNDARSARDAAQGHLASMLRVYRGALAVPPLDGTVGHFYFDTNLQQAQVYTAFGWAPLFTVTLGGVRHGQLVATEGQTEFPAGGHFTLINVFKNGALIVPGEDYVAESPTITLTTGAEAGDVVAYIAYYANSEAEFYTKAASDARFASADGGTY